MLKQRYLLGLMLFMLLSSPVFAQEWIQFNDKDHRMLKLDIPEWTCECDPRIFSSKEIYYGKGRLFYPNYSICIADYKRVKKILLKQK